MNTLSIFTLLLVTSVQKFLSLRTHGGFLRHFIHLSKSQSGIITAPPKDSLECFREIHPCSSTHGPDSGTPISMGCLPYDRVSSSRTRTGSHFLPHHHHQQSLNRHWLEGCPSVRSVDSKHPEDVASQSSPHLCPLYTFKAPKVSPLQKSALCD